MPHVPRQQGPEEELVKESWMILEGKVFIDWWGYKTTQGEPNFLRKHNILYAKDKRSVTLKNITSLAVFRQLRLRKSSPAERT